MREIKILPDTEYDKLIGDSTQYIQISLGSKTVKGIWTTSDIYVFAQSVTNAYFMAQAYGARFESEQTAPDLYQIEGESRASNGAD